MAHKESGRHAPGLQDWPTTYGRIQAARGLVEALLPFFVQTSGKIPFALISCRAWPHLENSPGGISRFCFVFLKEGQSSKIPLEGFFFVWLLHAFCSLGLCIVLTSFPLVNGRPLITFSFVFACIQGLKKVRATGIGVHTPEEIIKMGTDDLKVLADMLGEKTFFFGDEPTTVNITSLSLFHSLLPTRWNESLMVLFYVCFLSQLYSARRRGFL